jgi:hypothetical protein
MFFNKKVGIEPALFERAEQLARDRGYASLEDFVAHLLERELAADPHGGSRDGGENADSRDKVLAKMRGLGYLK